VAAGEVTVTARSAVGISAADAARSVASTVTAAARRSPGRASAVPFDSRA